MSERLTRVGVFYDGNYFLHVSNYYNYDHERAARLSIAGLHRYIESRVAADEGRPGLAKIVEAHYFRGRLSAQEAEQRGKVLYYDRVFDDILTTSGITTHYQPLRVNHGRKSDGGMDVRLALEAFEATILKELDVVVLIASDSNYTTLARKIQARGCRVMVLGWDFEFTADNGTKMVTRTSQDLLDEASHPLMMNLVINEPEDDREAALVDDLFVASSHPNSRKNLKTATAEEDADAEEEDYEMEEPEDGEIGDRMDGEILSLKNGYGFIKYPPNNLFFHHSTVQNGLDFKELYVGDSVVFTLSRGDKGKLIATDVELVEEFVEQE